MNLKKTLNAFMREVIAEADANPDFRDRLGRIFDPEEKPSSVRPAEPKSGHGKGAKRPSNRRTASVVDPVQLAREGEDKLRQALAGLDIEQLRDVVADYGMDPGKLVMKWRDPDRIIDRIVEVARGRAQNGSAFLHPTESSDARGESDQPSASDREHR